MGMNTKRAEEILLEAKEIFDECGIEFFLICGTCLGAVREGIIFPYDGDIDLGVRHEILREKITTLSAGFMDKGYAIEYRSCQYGYQRSCDFRKDGIHICVRDYDTSGEFVFHARIISPDNATLNGTCSIFPKYLFDNLKKIQFLGKEFLVPNPPEHFMELHYDDWRTPHPEEHRCFADIENSFSKLMEAKK